MIDLNLIYKVGKERIEYRKEHFPDYKLRFPIVQVGEKKKVIKWLSEEEFLDFERLNELVDRYMIASIDSTLLPNEVVIESDMESEVLKNSVFELIRKYLQQLGLKYVMVFSGNKSVHFHIFFKNYNIAELRQIKENLYSYLKSKIPGIDNFGFKENHPYRLPGSAHPESLQRAEILIDDYSGSYLKDGKFIVESEVPKELLPKPKTNVKVKIKAKRETSGSKLRQLYEELLKTKIEDGRDRVALILFTIASFLDLPNEEFKRDILEWARNVGWKEYRVNWFIDAYERRDKYFWSKNWKWAIRSFLQASDIEEKSYNAIKEVIVAKLPWAEKYLK